jgi:hypothetical protein
VPLDGRHDRGCIEGIRDEDPILPPDACRGTGGGFAAGNDHGRYGGMAGQE